jgi:hypothetical protein
MQLYTGSFVHRSLFLSLGITLFLASVALTCRRQPGPRDISVTSRTTYSGIINGSPINVDVLATINTGRGGSSACTFTSLPTGFNPAVLGTMA